MEQVDEKICSFPEDYTEFPVDMANFLDDPDYQGKYFAGKFLADRNNYWRKALEEIYPSQTGSRYQLIFLKGPVGGGKTTAACAGVAYDLYRLEC